VNRLKQRVERIEQHEKPDSAPVIVLTIPVECQTPVVDGKEWHLSECGRYKVMRIVCDSRFVESGVHKRLLDSK
jgi:hypothetical protein